MRRARLERAQQARRARRSTAWSPRPQRPLAGALAHFFGRSNTARALCRRLQRAEMRPFGSLLVCLLVAAALAPAHATRELHEDAAFTKPVRGQSRRGTADQALPPNKMSNSIDPRAGRLPLLLLPPHALHARRA